MSIAGTPRKCVVAGVSYVIVGDADPQETPSTEKEIIPTTGEPIEKHKLTDSKVEGFKIKCTSAERDALDVAIAGDPVPVSYTEADGSTRMSGAVSVARGNRSLGDGTVELTFYPIQPWQSL